MRIAAFIFGLLGAAGALLLGIKWQGDMSSVEGQAAMKLAAASGCAAWAFASTGETYHSAHDPQATGEAPFALRRRRCERANDEGPWGASGRGREVDAGSFGPSGSDRHVQLAPDGASAGSFV